MCNFSEWNQVSRNPLFIGNAFATTLELTAAVVKFLGGNVAIPYSSGMLLLHRALQRLKDAKNLASRNPLFIGNAFATDAMDAYDCESEASQSPIHRECFCYRGLPSPGSVKVFVGRNPLFIGNAFATNNRSTWRLKAVSCRNPLFIGNAFATCSACIA